MLIFNNTSAEIFVKLIYSEKATNFCKISTVDLTFTTYDNSKVECVAFSKYMNFNIRLQNYEYVLIRSNLHAKNVSPCPTVSFCLKLNSLSKKSFLGPRPHTKTCKIVLKLLRNKKGLNDVTATPCLFHTEKGAAVMSF